MMKEVGSTVKGEESATVGAEVTSLSNTPVEATPTDASEAESDSRKLLAIPEGEEALQVGSDIGE